MSSPDDLPLPPLATDGRVDLLTGLEAPEIFYRFLEKAIASSVREASQRVGLVIVRLIPSKLAPGAPNLTTEQIEYVLVVLAEQLRSMTRSDENLTRIGETTFILLAKVADASELDAMLLRFKTSLSELRGIISEVLWTVDSDPERGGRNEKGPRETISRQELISLESCLHSPGESLLDLLERAGV